MPRILEDEAALLARSLDIAPAGEKPWMLDVLGRYQQQQNDLGDPEWPSQAQAAADDQQRVRGMFGGLDKVPFDVSPWSKDPENDKAVFANMALLAHRYGKTPQEIADRHDFYRNNYAQQAYGKAGGVDEKTFYSLAANEIKRVKQKEDTEAEGVKAALRGDDVIPSLQAWQAKNLDRMPDSTEFTRGFLKARERAGEHLEFADTLLKQIESNTGLTKGDGGQRPTPASRETAAQFEESLATLAAMKPKDRKQVYAIIGAKAEAAGYDQKGFWSQMLSELGKGTARMGSSVTTQVGVTADVASNLPAMLAYGMTGNPDFGMTDTERSATDSSIARRQGIGEMYDEIAGIVAGGVDPVKPVLSWLNDSVETGLIKGPGAVAPFMMASAALGGFGAGALFTVDFAEQNRRELRAGGMDNAQAVAVGSAAAPLQAVAESLSNSLQLGRFPAVQRVLSSFTKPIGGGAGLAARYLQNSGLSLATEFTEEQLQDNFIVPATQELLGAFEKDFPAVDWSMYRNRAVESTSELLSILAPMALVFGGTMTSAQANLSAAAISSQDMLEAAGYSAAQANEVRIQPTEEAKIIKAREFWGARAGTPQTIETAAKTVGERMRMLQGNAIAAQKDLESRGILPRMLHATEGAWKLTFNDGSTADFNSHREADAARWQWATDQLGKVHLATRSALAQLESGAAVGREFAVEFKPDVMTAQIAVNEGRVDPAQIERRVQQGAAVGESVAEQVNEAETFDNAVATDKATSDYLASLQILGSSSNEFKDGVLRTTIKLYEGANVLTLVEEKLEGDAKQIIASKPGREWMLSKLREYERVSGDSLFRKVADDSELQGDDLIEAWSSLGQSYLVGKSKKGAAIGKGGARRIFADVLKAGMAGAMNSETQFFNAVWRRAAKLSKLKREGKLGDDLAKELERQLGIDSQAKFETEAAKDAEAIANEALYAGDTSSYSEENPGPNGETFSLRKFDFSSRLAPAAETLRSMKQSGKAVDFPAIYKAASVGQSSSMLPLDRLFDEARKANAALTEAEFGKQTQALYESGALLLEPGESPQAVGDALAKFGVRDSLGIPAMFARPMEMGRETFSLVSPAQDAEYMAAVESGDVAKQQAMVDAAAKAAGGLSSAEKANILSQVAKERQRLEKKTGITDADEREEMGREETSRLEDWVEEQVKHEAINLTLRKLGAQLDGMSNKSEASYWRLPNQSSDFRIRVASHDAVYAISDTAVKIDLREIASVEDAVEEAISAMARLRGQADPITRDEQGNVIPLSQRFNPADNRITYSLRPGNFASRMSAAFSPFQRNPELRMAIAQVAKARAQKLGAEWIEKAAVIRSIKDISKESRTREALAYEAQMNEYLDGLSEAGRLNLEFEPASLEDDPLIAAMLDHGKLMSRSTAIKNGVQNMDEYEGAPWLPPAWYSKGVGITPGKMAKALHEGADGNGGPLTAGDSAADLWNAIDIAITSTRKNKAAHREAVAAYKAAQKYAKDSSRAEADKWAEGAKKKAGSPKAQREMLKGALRLLDGILAAAPPEVRARVGGYVKLAGLATDEAMLDEIERRIEKLNAELEKWLKKEIRAQLDKLFERAAPKMEAGKKPKGSMTPEAHRAVMLARDAMAVAEKSMDGKRHELQQALMEPDADLAGIMEEMQVLELFGGMDAQNAESMSAALEWLSATVKDGKNRWRMLAEQRLAELRENADALRQDTGTPHDIASLQDDLPNEKTVKRAAGGWGYNLISFEQVMTKLFGEDSKVARELVDSIRQATYQRTDAVRAKRDEFNDVMRRVFGSLNYQERLWDFAQTDAETAMSVSWMKDRKETTVKVPVDTVRKIIEDRASAKALGFDEAEVINLMEQFAANDGLPGNRQKDNLTITRLSPGTPTALKLSQNQAINLTMLARQKDYQDTLTFHGYTPEVIAEIESKLEPEAKEIRAFLARQYEDGYQSINAVFQGMFGAPLPKIANYSPGTWEALAGEAVIDPDGSGMVGGGLSASALKTRRVHRAAPRLADALVTYWQHVGTTEYFKAFAAPVRDLRGILLRPEVRAAITARGGSAGIAAAQDWVKIFENDGVKQAHALGEIEKFQSRLQQAISIAALAWNLGTLAKQSTAILGAYYEMPTSAYLKGFARLLRGKLEMGAIMKSDMIRRRVEAGASPELRQIMAGMLGQKPGSNQITRGGRAFATRGMEFLGETDGFFTAASAAIYFDHALSEALAIGMNETQASAEAIRRTESMVDRTAQPVEMMTRSLFENKLAATPSGKWLFMFASDARQKAVLYGMAVGRIAKGNGTAADGRVMFIAHVVAPLMLQTIANMIGDWRDDDDDELFDEKNWNSMRYVKSMLLGPAMGIPLLSGPLNSILSIATGQPSYENDPTNPLGSTISKVIGGSYRLASGKGHKNDELEQGVNVMKYALQAVAAASSISPVGGGNAWLGAAGSVMDQVFDMANNILADKK